MPVIKFVQFRHLSWSILSDKIQYKVFLGLQFHQTFQMHHHHHHWRDWIHLHHQGFDMTWHTLCAFSSVNALMKGAESVSETLKCLNHLMQQSAQADCIEILIKVLSHHLLETSAVSFSSNMTLEIKKKTIPFLCACHMNCVSPTTLISLEGYWL